MSIDEDVTKDLIETLEDGADGYAKGADKLAESNTPDLAATFRELSQQRARFSMELSAMAEHYGDHIVESGSVAAALHRGWMGLKDALSGDDPNGVLDTAEQGEDHALKEYDKALAADISAELRTVVERQRADIQIAHDKVRRLRDAA